MAELYDQLLPVGFRVERVGDRADGWVRYEVYEDGAWGGWVLAVDAWWSGDRGVWPRPQVGWVTASDTRPEVARALAVALLMASDEVGA